MNGLPVSLDAPLDELLDAARAKYEVAFEPVTVAGCTLEVLQISNMEQYLEKIAETLTPETPLELPLWAKIWRSSFILSYYLKRLPHEGKTMLEIGAGVGVCGLFAAAQGFDTVISDVNPEALLFSRINVLKNGLEGKATVARIDFTKDRLGRRFDYVIGSEVLYKDDNYRPLVKFLLAHMQGGKSEAVLVKEYTRKAKKFFKLADRDFNIQSLTIGFKGNENQDNDAEKHLAQIHRLAKRKNA